MINTPHVKSRIAVQGVFPKNRSMELGPHRSQLEGCFFSLRQCLNFRSIRSKALTWSLAGFPVDDGYCALLTSYFFFGANPEARSGLFCCPASHHEAMMMPFNLFAS
jgi:hypothetical protein